MTTELEHAVQIASETGKLQGENTILREENMVLRYESRKLLTTLTKSHERIGALEFELRVLKVKMQTNAKL